MAYMLEKVTLVNHLAERHAISKNASKANANTRKRMKTISKTRKHKRAVQDFILRSFSKSFVH